MDMNNYIYLVLVFIIFLKQLNSFKASDNLKRNSVSNLLFNFEKPNILFKSFYRTKLDEIFNNSLIANEHKELFVKIVRRWL
jgi:hypothetical protein